MQAYSSQLEAICSQVMCSQQSNMSLHSCACHLESLLKDQCTRRTYAMQDMELPLSLPLEDQCIHRMYMSHVRCLKQSSLSSMLSSLTQTQRMHSLQYALSHYCWCPRNSSTIDSYSYRMHSLQQTLCYCLHLQQSFLCNQQSSSHLLVVCLH